MNKLILLMLSLMMTGCFVSAPSKESGMAKVEVSDEAAPSGRLWNSRVEVSQITNTAGIKVFDFNEDISFMGYTAEIPEGDYTFSFRCGIAASSIGHKMSVSSHFKKSYSVQAGKLYKLEILNYANNKKCDAKLYAGK